MTATAPSGGRRVALVTDSSACLPADEVARLRITVVPIVLVWHGVELRDGVDITPTEFWRRLATDPELPTTSTMSAGAYLDAFDALARQGCGVVCTCLPRRFSTMYEAALIARRDLDGHVPVDVIETGGAAMACGFPTLLGARAAGAGAGQQAVVAAVERAIPHSEILAVLDNLEYVARSGRVPAVVARIASAFPSTFVLRLHNRKVGVGARFGSRARAIAGMVERVKRRARGATYLGVTVHHCANVGEAEALVQTIARELRPDDLYLTSFTSVMGAHVGPGLTGISFCALPA